MALQLIATSIPDVKLLAPDVFGDARGFFVETWQSAAYQALGVPAGEGASFVQDNHSRSGRGVLRGLHFQLKHPQGKLVRVSRGCVLDVALDIRRGSPTFGQHVAVELSDENHHQFYVPPGFAHGFVVLSEVADFQYKCTDFYHPEDEGSVLWNDAALGIDWQMDAPQLSAKDQAARPLAELTDAQLPVYCS